MAEAEDTVQGLDPDELDLMNQSRRWHRSQGRPEKAHLIEIAMNENRRLPEDQRRDLLRMDETTPEVEVDPTIVMPPRTGKGATKKNWREYAAQVTDWEPEVIAGSGMGEIIAMLEANAIIPTNETDDE